MGEAMKLHYDPVADILYLQHCAPNKTQRVREVSEGVLVRLNAESGVIEGYEVHGWLARSRDGAPLSLPLAVPVRPGGGGGTAQTAGSRKRAIA